MNGYSYDASAYNTQAAYGAPVQAPYSAPMGMTGTIKLKHGPCFYLYLFLSAAPVQPPITMPPSQTVVAAAPAASSASTAAPPTTTSSVMDELTRVDTPDGKPISVYVGKLPEDADNMFCQSLLSVCHLMLCMCRSSCEIGGLAQLLSRFVEFLFSHSLCTLQEHHLTVLYRHVGMSRNGSD